jgi:thiol:disulfide interchange protein
MIFAFFSSCCVLLTFNQELITINSKKEEMAQKGLKILFILFIIASINSRSLAQEAETVKWYTIEEVQKLVKNEPRKIYIDMYTDWCGWCKVMDKKTFTDDRISSKLNSTFYAVKFDAEGKNPVDFKTRHIALSLKVHVAIMSWLQR